MKLSFDGFFSSFKKFIIFLKALNWLKSSDKLFSFSDILSFSSEKYLQKFEDSSTNNDLMNRAIFSKPTLWWKLTNENVEKKC